MALKTARSLFDLVGNTPLIRINKIPERWGFGDLELYGKAEFMNPSGSLKDRIIAKILSQAMKDGRLKPGMTIVESTTGNTGISTAMFGAHLGLKVMIVIPAGMSAERMKTLKAFGAEIVHVPGGESDVDLAVEKAREIARSDPDRYFFVDQFNNPANAEAHYETTGPEIWEQMGGRIDAFVATAGTGGTITGVGRYLKERNPRVKVYVAEPAECPLLSKQRWGSHRIEGIGDGFIPSILDLSVLDGVITVSSDEAIEMTQQLIREEGLFVGISSGANVKCCLKLHRRHPELRRVVTMLNDHAFRYFSTRLFGVRKELKVPERPHPISVTPEQRRHLSRLEIIE